MTRIKKNLIKNARCEKCGEKLHRQDIYSEVTRQYVELHATCPACKHSQVIDRKHRDQVNC